MNPLPLIALLLLAGPVRAQTTAPLQPDSVHTAPRTLPSSPLTLYLFLDAYYGHDLTGRLPDRPAFLYSHDRAYELTANNAILGARYQGKSVRGALALHAGTYVVANYAAEPTRLRYLYEAYAGFRPTPTTWLDLGIFPSHIGFESAISKDNWTLTRSLMAENSPYYESGARLTWEATLTLTALALNGWQNIRDLNRAKAAGWQIQWHPDQRLLLNSSSFYGNEQPTDSAARPRYFHNFYASFAATSRLSLAAVFDAGLQTRAPRGPGPDTWHTAAFFVRYSLSPRWSTTLRAEYYRATRGIVISSPAPSPSAPTFLVRAASLNADYAPAAPLLFRVEARLLHAPSPLFAQTDGRPTSTYANLTSSIA
ncbi:MAG TPA: outer membrane beta-barrel protein, partial [bacterium]|nr:outer membrane beta-barrel protein [bacterium]